MTTTVHSDGARLGFVFGNEHAAFDEATGQVHCREIVLTTELLKAHDAVDCHPVLEKHDCGQNLDLELVDEEGALFGVDSNESRLGVHPADFVQVHVHDFASLEVFVEKGAHHVVCARHSGQELLFDDLSVCAVALRDVCALLLEFGARRHQSFLSHLAQ